MDKSIAVPAFKEAVLAIRMSPVVTSFTVAGTSLSFSWASASFIMSPNLDDAGGYITILAGNPETEFAKLQFLLDQADGDLFPASYTRRLILAVFDHALDGAMSDVVNKLLTDSDERIYVYLCLIGMSRIGPKLEEEVSPLYEQAGADDRLDRDLLIPLVAKYLDLLEELADQEEEEVSSE